MLRPRQIVASALIAGALVMGGSAVASIPPTVPHVTIRFDGGGKVEAFDQKFRAWKRKGVHVRIVGFCASSCTRLLFPKFGLDYCVERTAVLAFHMPYWADEKERPIQTAENVRRSVQEWNSDWLPNYPKAVREFVRQPHNPSVDGDRDQVVELRGKALKMLKECP
jgi:hypothetical protein